MKFYSVLPWVLMLLSVSLTTTSCFKPLTIHLMLTEVGFYCTAIILFRLNKMDNK